MRVNSFQASRGSHTGKSGKSKRGKGYRDKSDVKAQALARKIGEQQRKSQSRQAKLEEKNIARLQDGDLALQVAALLPLLRLLRP